jgi:ABC-2 type transport system permease protein
MNGSLLRLELRRSRTLIGWLAVTLVLYNGTMALFYPSLVDARTAYEEILKIWPKELVAAFGLGGGLGIGDPGVFFNTYIGGMVWPIVAAMAGILLATRQTAVDVDRGWAEIALSTPVSRTTYLAVAVATQVVGMAVLALVSVLAMLVAGAFVDAGFDAGRFLLTVPVALVYGCAIAAVTTLLGAATLSRGIAGGITAGIILGMYLAEVLSKLDPGLDALKYVSCFHYFDSTAIVDAGTIRWEDVAVFVGVSVACWLLALAVFRRRDLLA